MTTEGSVPHHGSLHVMLARARSRPDAYGLVSRVSAARALEPATRSYWLRPRLVVDRRRTGWLAASAANAASWAPGSATPSQSHASASRPATNRSVPRDGRTAMSARAPMPSA